MYMQAYTFMGTNIERGKMEDEERGGGWRGWEHDSGCISAQCISKTISENERKE